MENSSDKETEALSAFRSGTRHPYNRVPMNQGSRSGAHFDGSNSHFNKSNFGSQRPSTTPTSHYLGGGYYHGRGSYQHGDANNSYQPRTGRSYNTSTGGTYPNSLVNQHYNNNNRFGRPHHHNQADHRSKTDPLEFELKSILNKV
jgi:hypothetical protein